MEDHPQPPPNPSASQPLPPAHQPGYVAPPPGYEHLAFPPQGYPPPPGYPQGYSQPMAYPPGYGPQGGYPAPGYPYGQPQMPMPYPSQMQPMPPQEPEPQTVAGLRPQSGSVPVVIVQAEPGHPFGEEGIYPAAVHDFGPAPRRNPIVVWWRTVGGGSLTLSILIHVGLLAVAGLVVFSNTIITKNVDFLPGGGTTQGAAASQELQHKVQNKKQKSISKTPVKKIVSSSANASISLPETPPDILDVPDVSSIMGGSMGPSGGFGKAGAGGGFGTGVGMGGKAGFISLPPSMRSRCSSAERLQKLAQNGGSSECEVAVSRGLEWLKTKQNPDGSWGTGYKSAMTGLALLCYLGRCETPESPFYGDNVMKGILYLIELSKKNEKGFITEDFKSNGGAYEHGIATYALGEMYTLARLGSKSLPGMREVFENGVKQIIDNQNETGGWDYYVMNASNGRGKSSRDDLSVTGWQYQALKAANHTGLKINGLRTSIEKTIKYIEKTQTKDGGIGTLNRDAPYNQWNLTGTGVLGLQTLGKGGRASVIDKGMKFLRNFITEEPLDWNKNCNLYCWYYYTQAFFQQGGLDWKFYNQQLMPQLLSNQAPDGSWKPERPNSPVAAVGNKEGGVYKTALCVLQLEVYYRYLKVADRDEGSIFDR